MKYYKIGGYNSHITTVDCSCHTQVFYRKNDLLGIVDDFAGEEYCPAFSAESIGINPEDLNLSEVYPSGNFEVLGKSAVDIIRKKYEEIGKHIFWHEARKQLRYKGTAAATNLENAAIYFNLFSDMYDRIAEQERRLYILNGKPVGNLIEGCGVILEGAEIIKILTVSETTKKLEPFSELF